MKPARAEGGTPPTPVGLDAARAPRYPRSVKTNADVGHHAALGEGRPPRTSPPATALPRAASLSGHGGVELNEAAPHRRWGLHRGRAGLRAGVGAERPALEHSGRPAAYPAASHPPARSGPSSSAAQ
ncbi:hypothetical protein GCM10009605_07900 [Nocardiopsis composta]